MAGAAVREELTRQLLHLENLSRIQYSTSVALVKHGRSLSSDPRSPKRHPKKKKKKKAKTSGRR